MVCEMSQVEVESVNVVKVDQCATCGHDFESHTNGAAMQRCYRTDCTCEGHTWLPPGYVQAVVAVSTLARMRPGLTQKVTLVNGDISMRYDHHGAPTQSDEFLALHAQWVAMRSAFDLARQSHKDAMNAVFALMDLLKSYGHPFETWPDAVKWAFSEAVISKEPLTDEDICWAQKVIQETQTEKSQ